MLRKIRATMLALMLAATVLFVMAPSVSAACAPGVPGVLLYELSNGTGDSRLFCGSVSNLDNYDHTQPGDCERINFDPDGNDWNNCADSMRIWEPLNTCLRIYNGVNYTNQLGLTFAGPWSGQLVNLGTSRDLVTSFKFFGC